MAQWLNGSVIFKTPAEFNVTFLHGTPYGVILSNGTSPKKKGLYFLDTKEGYHYPIAEWDEDDCDSSQKWKEYALDIDRKYLLKNNTLNSYEINTILED